MGDEGRNGAAVGLSARVAGCLFDLDGVLTQTAVVHAKAWTETFDAFLRERSHRTADLFVPFDAVVDYDRYVDGEPREDGIRSFLSSRGIVLPDGDPKGAASSGTVRGLAERKNEIFLALLDKEGAHVYRGSLDYLIAVRRLGIRCAVVSSSTNCRRVLQAAGIEDLFAVRVDGVTAAREHLAGKPSPDSYLFAARALGLEPANCVVFEDAIAGVEAGRAGGFAEVVGVDRVGQAAVLKEHGATVLVSDLAELLEDTR